MKLGRMLVFLGGGFFILYGILFAAAPVELARLVTDGGTTSPSGLIDMRATYGGMSIAFGMLLVVLARKASTLRLSVAGLLIVMICMATTRTIGIVVDGSPNVMMYVYLTLELVVSAICLLCLKLMNETGGDA
jgi:hypothetical protein